MKESNNLYLAYYSWAAFVPYDGLTGNYRAADAATQWVNVETGEEIKLSANDLQVYAHIFKQSRNDFLQHVISDGMEKTKVWDCSCGDSSDTIAIYIHRGGSGNNVLTSIKKLVKAGLVIRETFKLRREDGRIVTIPKLRPASYEEWLSSPIERYVLIEQEDKKATPKDKPLFKSKADFITNINN